MPFYFCEQKTHKFIKFKLPFYLFILIGTEFDSKTAKDEFFITWNLSQFLHGMAFISPVMAAMFNSAWSRCYEYGRPYVHFDKLHISVVKLFIHFDLTQVISFYLHRNLLHNNQTEIKCESKS